MTRSRRKYIRCKLGEIRDIITVTIQISKRTAGYSLEEEKILVLMKIEIKRKRMMNIHGDSVGIGGKVGGTVGRVVGAKVGARVALGSGVGASVGARVGTSVETST